MASNTSITGIIKDIRISEINGSICLFYDFELYGYDKENCTFQIRTIQSALGVGGNSFLDSIDDASPTFCSTGEYIYTLKKEKFKETNPDLSCDYTRYLETSLRIVSPSGYVLVASSRFKYRVKYESHLFLSDCLVLLSN